MVNGKYTNGFNKKLAIEDDLIFGLVKSSDLQSPLVAKPRKHIILTQKKVGEDTAYLAERFPNTYQYLTENVRFFSERKSNIYKRRPQFAIFGIGEYSFKPYKVAISGLYKKPFFSLILPFYNKPVMLDDTCYFLGFDDISESLIALSILGSSFTHNLLRAITFIDAKRPYTKDVLMRIDLIKIAEHIEFENAQKLLSNLPDDIVQNMTREKWDTFVAKYRKEQEKQHQYTLFEKQHPAFTQATE
jgi:hypothetical protein